MSYKVVYLRVRLADLWHPEPNFSISKHIKLMSGFDNVSMGERYIIRPENKIGGL